MEEIARKLFEENLEQVAPALATRGLVPVLTHYWFTGETVMAYNDQIAISVPMETTFTGAVAGDTLLRLIKSSGAKKAKVELDQDVLHVHVGRAKVKVPSKPASDFVFDMPKMKSNAPVSISLKAFVASLSACLDTVRSDTAVPDQLGVTVIPDDEKGGLHLISTDSAAITYEFVEADDPLSLSKKSFIMPAAFCKELVKSASGPDLFLEQVKGDYVLFRSPDDLHLFGRLLDISKPYEFLSIIAGQMKKHPKKKIPIPKMFEDAVERSCIILDAAFDNTLATVSVSDGELHFHSESDRGEVSERMALENHPDVTAKFEPRHLKLGCDGYTHMTLSENSAVFYREKGEGKLFVSATEG